MSDDIDYGTAKCCLLCEADRTSFTIMISGTDSSYPDMPDGFDGTYTVECTTGIWAFGPSDCLYGTSLYGGPGQFDIDCFLIMQFYNYGIEVFLVLYGSVEYVWQLELPSHDGKMDCGGPWDLPCTQGQGTCNVS